MIHTNECFREQKEEIMPLLADKVVLSALCRFIWCSQEFLKTTLKARFESGKQWLVTLRWQDVEQPLNNGYYSFSVPKNTTGTEFRTISAPSVGLKTIQLSLLQALRQVPVSQAVQWGEPWTSPKKNALQHRASKYLYTTDVKSAYPSVSAQRIYKNLEWWLGRVVDFSFPYLTPQQREHFFHILTTLISHHDALPQWAPTSARMLNIAMAKTDTDLTHLLHWPESSVIRPVYTRYIDDLAFSFEHFSSFAEFAERGKEMVQKTTTVAEQYASWFSRDITSVSDDIDSFLTTSYEIADDASKSRMRTCYFLIKEQLVKVRDHTKTVAWWSVYNTCYRLIWEIDKRVALLNESEDVAAMEIFMDKIKRVVNANGWTLKQTKDRLRLPNNTTAKEITWVLIWPDGRTGISQEKMAFYTSLAKQATLTPQLLDRKYKNPDGSVDVLALAYVLHGMRNFIHDVKWRVPEYFEKRFLWAQAKHFPKVKVPKGTQSMQGVSNGGV